MDSVRYIFEGEAPIKCSKCGFTHTLYFSGVSPCTVKQAINEALESEQWGVSSMTCPDCYDPLDDVPCGDTLIDEEEAYDDDDLYDEEWD